MSNPNDPHISVTVRGDVIQSSLQVAQTIHNHHAHHHNHTHIHEVPAFALQAHPAPPARQGRRTGSPTPKRDVTPAQRDCLALMHPLPKPVRVDVLIWMRCEFGTSLVLDLDPRELHRLRGHVLDVRRSVGL